MKRFLKNKAYLVLMLILGVFIVLPGHSQATFDDNDNIPAVSSTVPVNGAKAVAIGSNLSATFSEAMKPATINTSTFTLKKGTTAVSGAVTYSGVTAVFNPTSNLLPGTLYTATITTGRRLLVGLKTAVTPE